jgi:hypothetical protein
VGGDPRIKEGLTALVQLNTFIHPGFKFNPVSDPKITLDDTGSRHIVSRTTAIGPGGKEWVLEITMTFGKRGRLAAYGVWFKPV